MKLRIPFAALAACLALAPNAALACACGCGVFDVGAESMPTESQTGLSVWFRYDFMDQHQNWEHGSKAPASDNGDKEIKTSFYTLGGEYMVNRNWMVMAELPIYDRALTTTDDGGVFGPSNAGNVYTGRIADIGDLQLSTVYTGLSPDMSTGFGLGVKLPTGNDIGPIGPAGGREIDRDTLPGTGSTDLMVSAYHFGKFDPDGKVSYFAQARYQFAVLTQDGYRPGAELDAAVGLTYDFGRVGPLSSVTPVLQLIDSYRDHDSGPNADPPNSGYDRLLISPGVGVRINNVHLYADVEVPIYQYANAAEGVVKISDGTSGQLVASTLYKLRLAYDF